MELKTVKYKKGEDCLRCGMSKKDLRKEYFICKVYDKHYKRHLFKETTQ